MPSRPRTLFGCILASAAVHAAVASATHRSLEVGALLSLLVAAQAALFAIYWIVVRRSSDRWLLPALAAAVIFRVIAASGEPIFENDHHRYLWDGKVAVSGINPYFYPPDSLFLEHLQDANWQEVTYSSIPTIYPPVCQYFFSASWALGGPNPLTWKWIVLAWDTATIAVLVLLLKRLDLPTTAVLIYAWNPLVIKEFANSAHVDALAVFWTTAFVTAWVHGRRSWSAVCLGIAIASKLFPLLLVPLTLCSYRLRDHALWIGTVALCYWPYRDAGELVLGSLGVYLDHWEFNDSGFHLLRSTLDYFGASNSYTISKIIVAVAVLATGLALSRRIPANPAKIPHCALIVIGTLCVLAPTVDPWYLTWLVPFLCVRPHPAWLVLTATATISYVYWWQQTDLWWIRPVEYLPFYLLLFAPLVLKTTGLLGKPNSKPEMACT